MNKAGKKKNYCSRFTGSIGIYILAEEHSSKAVNGR